jgi:murein DD-endopeptidase MepM/ murein hydrolase activator NlpD
MTGKKWTFLVVRDEGGPVRQYSLSTRLLKVLGGVGAAVALVIAAVTVLVGLNGSARLNAHRLESQNQALRAEIDQFQNRVGELEVTLGTLSKEGSNLRTLAGLETFDPDILEVGVGGPGLGSPEEYGLWAVDSMASKSAFALTYDLSALERRALLLSSSLGEAADSLAAHRDLMESTPSILPTNGWLSSRFSQNRMHPVHNRPMPHPGVDIAADKGTPIYAAAKGRVVRAGWVVGYGLTVEIDHGYGYTTLYGHASQLLVRRGQEITRGDIIAQVGATGVTTSSHLHYEVRINGVAQNPANFILPESVP